MNNEISTRALYILITDRNNNSYELTKWVNNLSTEERKELIRWLEMQVRLVTDSLENIIEIFEAIKGATK